MDGKTDLMHESAMDFALGALTAADVEGQHVLEAGSYNLNGSVRGHVMRLGPASYLGVDLQRGDGVDLVMDAVRLPVLGREFGVVISTEMLEHVEDWRGVMRALVEVLAPGGVMMLTTRSPGFAYHPHPVDCWRYPVDMMGAIVKGAGLEIITLLPDPTPGVFVKARKPLDWAWPESTGWDAIELPTP